MMRYIPMLLVLVFMAAPSAMAEGNPCNPCSMKNPCNPCAMKHANPCNPCAMKHANPCNPCSMKKTANPCNPCAMKHANPCNPCSMKKTANPCNPCAMKHANPCNPCSMEKNANPCNPCSMKGANPCSMKNPCNPCAMKGAGNPCNPCASNAPTPIRPHAFNSFQQAADLGKSMWNDASLGTSGLTCMNCHDGYENLNLDKNQNFPHHVNMVGDVVSLDQMINFCMINPMQGEQFEKNSKELTAMGAYFRAYRMQYIHKHR